MFELDDEYKIVKNY